MAGHSKWANIQHRKKAQDAKRGKLFTKVIREIVVAAKMGGGDPDANPRLRAVVDKALSVNMTRDTIDRAIKRGAGGGDDTNMDELVYEGYGPGGVAVLVECLTDNKNRTVADVRHAFSKVGGNLGTSGSVAYLFAKKGQLIFSDTVDEELLMDVALENGADDIVNHEDGSFEVLTEPEDYLNVKDALKEKGIQAEASEITMIASTASELDVETGIKVIKMIERLEDLDDTQNVYTNAEIPAESYEAS